MSPNKCERKADLLFTGSIHHLSSQLQPTSLKRELTYHLPCPQSAHFQGCPRSSIRLASEGIRQATIQTGALPVVGETEALTGGRQSETTGVSDRSTGWKLTPSDRHCSLRSAVCVHFGRCQNGLLFQKRPIDLPETT